MRVKSRTLKSAQIILAMYYLVFMASEVFGELTITDVFSLRRVCDGDVDVTITGTGFDKNTRVAIIPEDIIISFVDIPSDDTSAHDIIIKDNIAYMTTTKTGNIEPGEKYRGELLIIDVSNPDKPEKVGFVGTPGWAWEVAVEEGTAYIADGGYKACVDCEQKGYFHIIDVMTPFNSKIINTLEIPGIAAEGVTVSGNIAYVAAFDGGLQIVDVGDPKHPQIIGSLDMPNFIYAYGITVSGDKVYMACTDNGGLWIADVSNPSDPIKLSSVDLPGFARKVTVKGDTAYVAAMGGGLQIVDVKDPNNSKIIGAVTQIDSSDISYSNIKVIDNMAYIIDRLNKNIHVVDITNPVVPLVIGSVKSRGKPLDIDVINNIGYVADDGAGLTIMPLPKEVSPVVVKCETEISVTLSGSLTPGSYTIKVFNETGHDEKKQAVALIKPVKKAIIVAGGGNDDSNFLWDKTRLCADYAYNAILFQEYSTENIRYLTPDTLLEVEKHPATHNNLRDAISNWASDADELLLYMVDHGGNGAFLINADEILKTEELDNYLDTLQMSMSCRVIFIYDACESGSFLPRMIPPDGRERIVLASSGSEESASFMKEGRLSFSYQFWAAVYEGADLNNAFRFARDMMNPYQTALVDADGDGVTTRIDVKLLSGIFIGEGNGNGQKAPVVKCICNGKLEQILSDETSATFCVSDIVDENDIEEVWAVITPPDFQPESSDIPITSLPTVELKDSDNDGTYEGVYNNFTQKGIYKVAIYAMDSEQLFSLPIHLTVIQTLNGVIPGDVDDNGSIELKDAILTLKLLTDENNVKAEADITGDGKIGIEESIYILQKVLGLYQGECL